MKRIKKKNYSIILKSLITHSACAMLLCALIGTLLLFFFMNAFQKMIRENRISRMQILADDIGNQIEIMRAISYSVKTTHYYRSSYINRNAYYKMELIKDFAKYSGYSPYHADYYLLNKENNVVFSPSSEYSYYVFYKYLLKLEDDTALRECLSTESSPLIRRLGDRILIVFPINVNGGISPRSDNVLFFIIDPAELAERARRISGLEEDNLTLSWQGEILYQGRGCQSLDQAVCYSDDSVSVYLTLNADNEYSVLHELRSLVLIMLLLFLLISAALTMYVGWKSQKPLQDMLEKFNLPGYHGDEGEIQQIEKLVNGALTEVRMSQSLLDEQMDLFEQRGQLLRQQIILLLLSGKNDAQTLSQMNTLDIALPYGLFCVLACAFDGGNAPVQDRMIHIIECMSDDSVRFYPVPLSNAGGLGILMNMENGEQVSYAKWMLSEAASTIGVSVSIRSGVIVDSLQKLPISFTTAIYARENETLDADPLLTVQSSVDGADLYAVLNCIQRGDEAARTHMSRILDNLDKGELSPVEWKLTCISIGCRLIDFAQKNHIHIPEDKISLILFATPDIDIRGELLGITSLLTDEMLNRNGDANAALKQSITGYIDAHFCDPLLDADMIARELHIQPRQINAAVKQVTGLSYREYVIRKRMDHARELLAQQELLVSEISVLCGYTNIPYFIRAFKADTGFSPREYRKILEGRTPADSSDASQPPV